MPRPATTLGFLITLALLPGLAPHEPAAGRTPQQAREAPPNIIYILADDLGYGDVSRLNDHSKIRTPNMDRLAGDGMIFADAHSSSSVCTPSRYGILTGRYAWRSRLKEGVLWGYSPPLIETGRLTVASFLKNHGYATGGVGKWHLGLGWQTTDQKPLSDRQDEQGQAVDFTKPVERGPTALGFDYFFGIPASLDMKPYVYIENDRVVELPTATIETHEKGGEGFWRGGRSAPQFRHIDVLPTLTQRAVAFIEREGRKSSDRPFFLYFALSAPHTPVVPNQRFVGSSRAGRYGDFVVQVDSVVGQVMQTVDDLGISRNTMIILTSDNGPERFMEARKGQYGHHSAYHFRGMKRDIWEGGHRVPFIVRWPAKVQPGHTNDRTVSLTDLLATVADVLQAPLPEGAGEDSDTFLPALLGTSLKKPLRAATVHHSSQGEFAIREGPWKLCLTPGAGGNLYKSGPNAAKADDPPVQLYNLDSDPGETKNLYGQHPEIVERLTKLLDQYKKAGRTHRLPKTPSAARASVFGPTPSRELLLDPAHPEWSKPAPPVARIRFETNRGSFVVELIRQWGLLGADRFYNLARLGFYDNTRFHRVNAHYIVQFGLSGDPAVTAAWRGREIRDDPPRSKNQRGTFAFAMKGPNTRLTQIYVNLADNSRNNREPFTILGTVVEGMDLLDRLQSGYGERSGSGMRQGRQGPIEKGGNAYLDREFPLLDRIIRACVIAPVRTC